MQIRYKTIGLLATTNIFNKTLQSIQKLMGSLTPIPQHLQLTIKEITPLSKPPTQFFSSTNWPKCQSIKQIRDQSMCGSCWAFSAVQAMSDRICFLSNQTLQTRISSEDLLSCCGPDCGKGCDGGYPPAAWTYFKNVGIVTGGLYNVTQYCKPYSFPPCNHHSGESKYQPCGGSQSTPTCTRQCINNATYASDKWYADKIYGVGKNSDVNYDTWTSSATFTVYADFLTYKSGVYHHTKGAQLGGHCVKLVGWGVENNVPYWLVANSWNQEWGDKGFFKIKRGDSECGIEGQVIAGIPKIKSSFNLLQQ